MKRLLPRSPFGRSRAHNPQLRRRRLFLETLENRSLMAVVSYWSADNTAADSVGTNNGTLISGTTYAAGQVGQAFSFDGVDDRVGVADSASLKLTGSMTIEGWVKATGLPVQQGEIFFRGDDRGGLDPYSLSVQSNGILRFEVSSLSGAMSVSTAMPLGEFVHVAATLDDATGEMDLYLNGVLMSHTVTTVRPFGDLDPASNPGIGIGNHGGYPATPHNFPFKGLIDDLKVYDNALSSQTVLDDFNAGKGTLQPAITISDATVVEGDPTPHYRGAFVEGALGAHFGTLAFGPDNNLYTMVGTGPGYNTIRRYNGTTGVFIDTYIPVGRINGPRDMLFREAYFYVASEYTDEVLRYNATTGSFVDVFVTAGSGGINGPHGMSFGPDANGDGVPELYVSGRDSFSVVRYNGVTGQPLGTYVTSGLGGLSWPEGMTFDAAGAYLYVASTGSNQILKYNAQTGAYVSPAASASLSAPKDVKFGPDGLMYIASGGNDQIVRFTASGGVHLGNYVPVGAGGMDNPSRMAFGPDGNLYVTAVGKSEILRFGTEFEAVFTVSLTVPNPQPITVDFATASGSAAAGNDYTHVSGTLTFSPGQLSKTIRVPLVDDMIAEPNETFTVNLSSAVGATIADGQGVATVADNDGTKFFVVNDGSHDRTYEYGPNGGALENYETDNNNASSRGAASTSAGNKVWIVDANRNVFVYSSAGGLLGLWTADSLPVNPVVEGIATNGTDIWLVEAKSDKVYRYAGAASRTSGSQSAADSFSLNSGNKDSKDIVTDGTLVWVVNDSSTDKVFKYTLSGSFLGSWTISGGGGSPTGITLNPSSASNIWIVDSSSDQVYQFDATAAGKTSGSLAPTSSFALSAGNTNPQGIADPPVGNSQVSAVDAAMTGEVVAAPVLAGVQTLAESVQSTTVSDDSDEERPTSVAVGNPAGSLSLDVGRVPANREAGSPLSSSSTYDDALCDIVDELESLAPVRSFRLRRM